MSNDGHSAHPLMAAPHPYLQSPDDAASQATFVRLFEVLERIATDMHALREIAERTPGRARPAFASDEVMAPLLAAIMVSAGAYAFTTAELVQHAAMPAATTLRAAIVAAVGAVNARRLGKALRSIEGRELGGLQIIREGMDREGVVWRVASLRK